MTLGRLATGKGGRLTALGAMLLAATFAVAGCGAGYTPPPVAVTAQEFPPLSELPIAKHPRDYQGPTTAILPVAEVVPVMENPPQQLPVTVTSHDLDREVEVTITDTSRVVAIDLAGSLAATVWGLGFGDTLVGRDITTTFPGTEDLPLVTHNGHSINAEAVIAQRPTLVITDGTVGPVDVISQLRDVGIPVVFVKNDPSFAGAVQLAHDVAAVYGAPEAGDLLADRIAGELASVQAQIAQIAPTEQSEKLRILFLYLRGASGVYYLFGEESGADQIITGLGAIDVAGELGWSGMKPLTDEALVAANPDLILVMTGGLNSVGGADGLIDARAAVAITRAGENRRIVDMADGQVLSFGPRSAEVLEALARAVYAPEYGL